MIFLDFETRSVLDVTKVGAYAYSVHPSTEVLCFSLAEDDGEIHSGVDYEIIGVSDWMARLFEAGDPIEAHNAFFERCIWENIMVKRHGWPAIDPSRWRCSSALAAAHALPRSLAGAAAALGLSETKDDAGHKLMLKMCKPRKPTKAELTEWQMPDRDCSQCDGTGGFETGVESAEGTPEVYPCTCTDATTRTLWHEEPEDLAALLEYNRQDVRAERALSEALRPLTDREQEIWHADQTVNARGIPVDLDLCRGAVALSREIKTKLNAELLELTYGAVEKTTQTQRLDKWLASMGFYFKNLTRQTIDNTLSAGRALFRIGRGAMELRDITGSIRRALEIRREGARASTAKYEAALRWVTSSLTIEGKFALARSTIDTLAGAAEAANGNPMTVPGVLAQGIAQQRAIRAGAPTVSRIRGSYVYCGAERTGRWSAKGLQAHNLAKGKLKGKEYELACKLITAGDLKSLILFFKDPMDVLRSCVRGIIRAPPGKTFVVGDFSAVEARVLFWLAGAITGLKLYRDGECPYSFLASTIFGVKYAELLAAYKAGDTTAENRRWVGKQSVLGFGFGMAELRFIEQCASYEDFATAISMKLAKAAKKSYRETFPEVPVLWKTMQAAAIEAVARQGKGKAVSICGGRVRWGMSGRFLCCRLPSGRVLHYFEPRVRMETVTGTREDGTTYSFEAESLSYRGVHGETTRWVRERTYGGKLVENVVQAIARDLLAEAILRCEAGRMPVVLHTHDEVVCEMPEEPSRTFRVGAHTDPNIYEKALKEIMRELPGWADGLPIDASVWIGPRYRK